MKAQSRIGALVSCLALAACVTQQGLIPPPLGLPGKAPASIAAEGAGTPDAAPTATRITETPRPPSPERTDTLRRDQAPSGGEREKADITLTFEQVPLPTMVQLVYVDILKRNINIDPAVNARKDLVTLRTGVPQTPSQVAEIARTLLKSYGIAVVEVEGLTRVVPDNAALGYLPEIRRGYALPETPLPLRPIFQLVELRAVRVADVSTWLKTMFGDKVRTSDDVTRNAVLLSGQSRDVTAAMEAIHVLDQPFMKGRHSVRVTPSFWSADELARRMVEILLAEGYNAGSTAPFSWAVTVLPVPAAGSVLVFAGDDKLLNHAVRWAKELDRPNEQAGGRGLFSYHAQYTDAATLARTLQQLLTGAPTATAPVPAGAPAAGATRSAAPPSQARVVVDQPSNMLIIQGGEDYSQIRSLLIALDKPAKEALIEVTIAEVTLTNDSQLGIEWLAREAGLSHGRSYTAGTLGGLGIGTSGFNFRLFDDVGSLRLVLNALASNNRASILSSPRVVARNGETASIQVGQEVPIITSQQVVTGTTGVVVPSTTTNTVPQSIQYRNTGVILNVKPVIHSEDQVSLEISQEVSAAQTTTTGVSTSPTFATRKVSTRMSLRNGATVMLGGLISSNKSEGNAGIPLLKEIPLAGQLFRSNTDRSDRTELIVLITAYVISNHNEAEAITDAFKSQLGDWARSAPAPAPVR